MIIFQTAKIGVGCLQKRMYNESGDLTFDSHTTVANINAIVNITLILLFPTHNHHLNIDVIRIYYIPGSGC